MLLVPECLQTGTSTFNGQALSCGLSLLDAQFSNAHLLQFGLIEIPKDQFQIQLNDALQTHRNWRSQQLLMMCLLIWHRPEA